ncbi:MAPEG family protein [Sphingomonas silueang]|uniref:MAPEG family protein n=1 Tax=Sphingomonas silueang TaxID=3156617 RepID=UPI0032B33101
MMTRALLWPTFAMVTLFFAVAIMLLHRRVGLLRRHPPTRADVAGPEALAAYFRPAALPAANLANLFEMPVLYFALVPLLLMTGQAGVVQVALAWGFVALRTAHSIAHLRHRLRWRLALFLLSNAVLAVMWVGFAIDMTQAAGNAPSPRDVSPVDLREIRR